MPALGKTGYSSGHLNPYKTRIHGTQCPKAVPGLWILSLGTIRFNLYNCNDDISKTATRIMANNNETVRAETHVVMGVSASTPQVYLILMELLCGSSSGFG